MYKVMVVDDEPIVGLTIKSICNWEKNDIEIAYEADNGKQALKILEEKDDIDIVITDLNMPIMDGIDLIKNMKDNNFNQKLIVLSSYKDYDLVRKSFKLGVEDYILKTEIDENNLLQLLKNTISTIEKKEVENNSISNEEIRILKDGILKKILEDKPIEDIDTKIKKNKIRLKNKNIIAFFLWVDDYSKIKERYNSDLNPFILSIKNTIKNIIYKEESGEIISLSPQEYVILYSNENDDRNYLENRVSTLLTDIKDSLYNYINITTTIGVSDIEQGYENIKNVYKVAKRNASFRFLLGKDKIISNNNISKVKNESCKILLKKTDEFLSDLKEGHDNKIMKEIDDILIIIDSSKDSDLSQRNLYYYEIIFIITNAIKEMNIESELILGKDINIYEKINEFETYEEINLWIQALVSKIVQYKENNKGSKYSYPILRVLKYINNNYTNPNLSLKLASNHVELSENYFSILFSNEVGQSFKEYIINLRINKAKELIENSNMKIYEVCEVVGYKNVEHFSRIFKKITGVSPNSFKKN